MSKRNSKEPRLLAQVLQAVADLKEVRGSTARKIVDQVQTAINLSNVRPKPRNVIGQVRRALKHGVRSGVLRQRSGKFRLATTGEINNAIRKTRTRRRRKREKGKGGGKTRRKKIRQRRIKKVGIRKRNISSFYDPSIGRSSSMKSQMSEYLTRPMDNRSNYSYYVVTGRRRRPKKAIKRKPRRIKRIRKVRKRNFAPPPNLNRNEMKEPKDSNNRKRLPRNRLHMDYDRQGNKSKSVLLYISSIRNDFFIFCNV